ncbi:MAG: hypothetical protein DRO88_11745 [Promethearchaeia archaeon]|nr:MAG: hypothetical protein DRO88_11745 [Candidatus Lokiarchaeia archaeon]
MEESKIIDQLDAIFTEIRAYYEQMDKIREKILPLQRKTVRMCSEIIKQVHRHEHENIPSKIDQIKNHLSQMTSLISQAPGIFPKDYVQIVKQETGEAIIFYHIVVHHSLPTPKECNIELDDFAYACADVVGEIRRYILRCLREEDLTQASHLLEIMTELYNYLFTLDYPNGLIPGLRKKIDAARGILARTEADITLSLQMHRLHHDLNSA